MLTAAAGFVFFALAFLLLIDPAMSGRKRLHSTLPLLHQQAAELQQLLAQAAPLANVAARPVTSVERSSVETALARHGLSNKSIVVTGNSAHLEFAATSFSGLINFLQDIQKAQSLQVSEAKFSAASTPGLVDATITLRQKRSE